MSMKSLLENYKVEGFWNSEFGLDIIEKFDLFSVENSELVRIDGDEGLLILDKALSNVIYFLNVANDEISDLYSTNDFCEAKEIYEEIFEAYKK